MSVTDTRLFRSAIVPGPAGRRSSHISVGTLGLYAFLFATAAFFVLPLYVMIVTSLKPMDEIRQGALLALPAAPSLSAWSKAWSQACTGMTCQGLRPGFLNSVAILIPSVALSTALGAINGYALAFWRVRGANVLFAGLLIGGFMPVQIFLYPLVRMTSWFGVNGTLFAIILMHVTFNMPIVTLIFRTISPACPSRCSKPRAWMVQAFFGPLYP